MSRLFPILAFGVLCVALPTTRAAVDVEKNNAAAKKGVEYLKSSLGGPQQQAMDTNTAGTLALIGLALLESDVPKNDPSLVGITRVLRETSLGESRTYNVALGILYFDKLNEPGDVPLIQLLGARLMIGQTSVGGWSYACLPEIPQAEVARLRGALKPTGSGLHPEAARLLKLGRAANPAAFGGGDDNSNTQFAIIGAWVAQRRGVPAASVISAIDNRFLRTQSPTDHGWGYNSRDATGGGSTPAMTCAGLLGLAVGKANDEVRKAGRKLEGEGNPRAKPKEEDPFFSPPARGEKPKADEEPDEEMVDEEEEEKKKKAPTIRDMAIERALSALGRVLGSKQAGPAPAAAAGGTWGGIDDLYFIWSLERVGVAYGLDTIGDVDWYDWGAKKILAKQQGDGSWGGSHGTPIETSFAVLFLKKANFVADLTKQIDGKVKDPGAGELRGSRGGPLAIAAMGRKINPNMEGPPDPKNPDVNKVRGPSEADKIAESLIARQPDTKWDGKIKAARDSKGGQWTAGLAQAIPFLSDKRAIVAREALADRLTRMTPDTLQRMLKDRDTELRRAACLAVAMKDTKSLTLDLIERVTDIDDVVVRAARASLKSMFNKDFGPPTGANDDRKRIALDDWKSWYTIDGPKP